MNLTGPVARALAPLFALLLLGGGCGRTSTAVVPTVEVETRPFEIRIEGRGELKAATATPIDIPASLRGVQRIAWLQPQGATVAAGELVARLDGEQLHRRRVQIDEELTKLDAQLSAKRSELARERRTLQGELSLLERERSGAEQYAPRDERLFSRHEILDAQLDLDLIRSKIEHARARAERYERRAQAEIEILGLQRETQLVKRRQLDDALSQLEIRAPHDGFFLRSRTWQGEQVRVGVSVWPGMSIGELPDVSEMEARIHVLESEAAGLADGLEAHVRLDAFPGVEIAGRVKSVQPVANPIDRESPVKYFEVLVSLERTDVESMKPLGQVTAVLWVAREDSALSVPNQAIFHEGDETWVWISDTDGFRRSAVRLGRRSLSRTVVEEGLEAGQRVALVDPEPEPEAG